MAHEMESMFSVKVTPWHGLGVILNDAPTTKDAIKIAGLDWNVSTRDLFTKEGIQAKCKAIVRDTDNRMLGDTGGRYVPLQNSEAFNWFDPFVASGEASLETAGSLRNGERVWILAKLKRDPLIITPKDTVDKYLLLSNGHDGKVAVKIGFTPIRVVCMNTLSAAHNDTDSKLIRVCHSRQVVDNLDKIRDMVNVANAAFEATGEQYKFLASRQVNKADLKKFVDIVFYNGVVPGKDDGRALLAYEKLTDHIGKLFEVGRGNDMEGTKGTYWALYNAATEYLNYDYGRQADTRINNLWFGTSKAVNDHAFEAALSLAKAG